MNLVATEPEHLEALKTWFPDKASVRQWGGPEFRHPFTGQNFLEDMRWQKLPAFSLLGETGELTGFGQYYDKAGRCHLARLAIAPSHRGRGYGRQFIYELMKHGMQDLKVNECSLFVMSSNESAVNCYRSLNFKPAPYPHGQPVLSGAEFMVYKHA